MSGRLRIDVDLAAVPVLHLEGPLDRRTTPVLREEAARILLDEPHDIVVDCTGVELVDSVGLRALLDVRRRLPATGQLVVSDAPPMLRRLLEVTALDRSLLVLGDGGVVPPSAGAPQTPAVPGLIGDAEAMR